MVQDVVPAVGMELEKVLHDAHLNFAALRGGIFVQSDVHLPEEAQSASGAPCKNNAGSKYRLPGLKPKVALALHTEKKKTPDKQIQGHHGAEHRNHYVLSARCPKKKSLDVT